MNNVTRGQTLFIVEGHHEKMNYLNLLSKFSLNLVLLKRIYIFLAQIFTNYTRKFKKNMERNGMLPPMMLDLPFVLNKYDSQRFESIGRKRNYKNIFLIFVLRSTRSQLFYKQDTAITKIFQRCNQ